MNAQDVHFPYETVRKTQDKLIETVLSAISNKEHLVVHAPTGLGKTVATIAPALTYALKNDLTIFFLTSRHTQHHIVIDTLKEIKQKHKLDFIGLDIIGKKWMCSQPGIEVLYSGEFSEYCKTVREDNKCNFYSNTIKSGKPTVKAKTTLKEMEELNPLHTEEVIETSKKPELCPYYTSLLLAEKARVIVADYNYIFHPRIRSSFLKKIDKELEQCIIIIDEGHNLPNRIREQATDRISNIIIKNAMKETKKFFASELAEPLTLLQETLLELSSGITLGGERKITKQDILLKLKDFDIEQLIEDFEYTANLVREQKKKSYLGSVANFLAAWQGADEGFSRILKVTESRKQHMIIVSYRCLDPAKITTDVISKTYSTIMMSGTLTPTNMYKDLLGFSKESNQEEYLSPFPTKNRLNLIVPVTTTKFTARSESQFKNIAEISSEVIDNIPGNVIVFFPSYSIRDRVAKMLIEMPGKTIFMEKQGMNKTERKELLEKFKEYKKQGAVLLAVASGSFGEGIDLPGDLLKGVLIVGLPLQAPDLETKELIEYYDKKLGKGWDYGYLFPAFNKTLQNAGRCIRSEKDKGVIIFLDERYAWQNYFRLFPKDLNIRVTKDFVPEIDDFFSTSL